MLRGWDAGECGRRTGGLGEDDGKSVILLASVVDGREEGVAVVKDDGADVDDEFLCDYTLWSAPWLAVESKLEEVLRCMLADAKK